MKRLEQILLVLFGIGILFKVSKLPGSGILLLLCVGVLSTIYFYLGFAFFNGIGLRKIFKKGALSEVPKNNIIFAIFTGIALSIVLGGILFSVQRWPGSGFMLLIGLVLCFLVLVGTLLKKSTTDKGFANRILLRTLIFLSLGVFLYLIPMRTRLEWEFPEYPEYIEAVLEFNANPSDPELFDKMIKEEKKVYEARNSMEEESE